MLGGDSITVGDRTITVQELSARIESAITAYPQTPGGRDAGRGAGPPRGAGHVLTIIVTFYLLLDGARFRDIVLRFLEPDDRAEPKRIAGRMHVVIGRWLRGQFVLVVLVALIVSVVLGPMLKLPYPRRSG